MKSFKLFIFESEPKICSSCGEEYTVRRHKMGLITHCDNCGREAEEERGVKRHVGLLGGAGINKSATISIFKNPSDSIAAKVKTLNKNMRVGGGLGMGSTVSNPGERPKKNEPK